MPPVLGPVSPSPMRLWSWAGTSGVTCLPSERQRKLISSPSRNSSMTTCCSGWPKSLPENLLWPELEIAAIAGNGEAAVHEALAQRPDVVFLDIRMPGMSGLEAAQAMAEDWPDDAAFPLLVFVTRS